MAVLWMKPQLLESPLEALKFAFDTLVIGALALPWLMVLSRLYLPPEMDGRAGTHLALGFALPEEARSAVLSVMILALGYCLGAAVARISDDFFGDAEVLRQLPKEASIRQDVYYHEYCLIRGVSPAQDFIKTTFRIGFTVDFCPNTQVSDRREIWDDTITQFFQLEESKVLLQGDDKTTRLRELHDQVVILRGATLNGIILSTLCFFGFCASFRSGDSGSAQNWRTFAVTQSAAVALILYGVYAVYQHFLELRGVNVFLNPPLAEALLILMGIGGLLAKARKDSRLKYAIGCGLSLALTIIAYGAWWWTEVIYNEGVIHTYPLLLG